MMSRNTVYNTRNRHWICKGCGTHYTTKTPKCPACGEKTWLFDSDNEYDRYKQLLWLEKSHKIRGLVPKRVFPLVLYDVRGNEIDPYNKRGGIKREIPTYESDFTYYEDGEFVVEDVKTKNPKADDPVFKVKAKIFALLYGTPIKIVRM